jgi:hypothetical protein
MILLKMKVKTEVLEGRNEPASGQCATMGSIGAAFVGSNGAAFAESTTTAGSPSRHAGTLAMILLKMKVKTAVL